jgi:hypothetical protein
MTIALHDIIVLDFSQGLSGPLCSLLLGDLGALVLKVEPREGDWARQLEPRQGHHSAVFLALNRNKISIALDYQSAAGQEVVQRLAQSADMVLHDAGPEQARTLGLDYATLAAHNPQLIYGLLTPFGEHGPWAHRAASELVVQAASGYPRYLGVAGQEPVRLGLDAASAVGGTFLLQGLLAALFYRQRSGCGQCVAVSQLGALYAVKTIQIAAQYNPDTWEGYHCWGPYNPPDTGWQTQDRPIVFSFGEFTGGGQTNRASGQPSAAPWGSTVCSLTHVSSPMAKIPRAWARMWPPCALSTRRPFATIRPQSWWNSYGVWRALPIRITPTRPSLLTHKRRCCSSCSRFQGPRVHSPPSKTPGIFQRCAR